MVTERFVSDNPFRLLSVWSGATYSELGQRLESGASRVSLAEEFGDDTADLEACVAGLAADPEKLTSYRFFWPFEGWGKTSEPAQLGFLEPWYSFVLGSKVEDAKAALQQWGTLWAEGSSRFVTLGQEDFDLDEPSASAMVQRSKAAVEQYLLTRIALQVASALDSGTLDEAKGFSEALDESGFDKGYREKAHKVLEEYGNLLNQEVVELASTLSWHPGKEDTEPEKVEKFIWLKETLGGDHPRVQEWDGVEAWRNALIGKMREEGVRLAEAGESASAASVFQRALAICTDPMLRLKILGDMTGRKEEIDPEPEPEAVVDEPNVVVEADRTARTGASAVRKAPPVRVYLAAFTVILVGGLGFAVINLFRSNEPAPSVYTADQPTKNDPPVVDPTPPVVQPVVKPPLDDARVAKQKEVDDLKADIKQLDASILTDEKKIKSERKELKKQKEEIDAAPDQMTDEELTDYNASVEKYEARRSAFNTLVENHNRQIDEEKKKSDRRKALVKELAGN